jgi:hypothetical protein
VKSLLFALFLAHVFALVVFVIDKDLASENSPDDEAVEPGKDPTA